MLLDDELPGLTYLKILCEQIPELEIVKVFNDPQLFVDEYKSLDFDLCILDIEMPTINGLEIAHLLHDKLVIFTTAYAEFAADAFDLNVVDYVRKPIKVERLNLSVQKALKQVSKSVIKAQFIHVATEKGKTYLDCSQIQLIRTSTIDSRDKLANMLDGSTILMKNISFEKLQEILPVDTFCRINKQELIACSCVKLISNDEITTSLVGRDGRFVKVNVTEKYKMALLESVKI